MAMPMDYSPGGGSGGASASSGAGPSRTDPGHDSERTDNPVDYKRTCIDFIQEISKDYKAWVDYYKLPETEDKKRRGEIDRTVARSNEWIARVATSIKSIDVIMNDGIQKMAEATAGRPFQIGVFVGGRSSYTLAKPGTIEVAVKAAGRPGRATRLGFHFKDDRFRVESTCGASFDETGLDTGDHGMLDIRLRLHAREAVRRDVVSFTVTVVESENGIECDRRGVSTAVHIV